MPEPRAIDGALVLAGIVEYPPDSVQGIYFRNMWTASHQLLALPLWLGLDQAWVMGLFNAALGASFVVGLALVLFTYTESVLLALPGALVIMLGEVVLPGQDYPILFISGHSYGQAALALSVLCLGLIGNRRHVAAGVVAGVLPAFHPVVGCWTVGVVLAGCVLAQRSFRGDVVTLFKGLAIGLGATAISFAAYWALRLPLEAAVDAAAYRAYLDNWDAHRNVLYARRTAGIALAILLLLWVLFDSGKRNGKPGIAQLSAALAVSTAGSVALYELVHRFHAVLPSLVSSAMLGRLINLHLLLVVPVIAGVLYLRRRTQPVFVVAMTALAFIHSSKLLVLVLVLLLALAVAAAASYLYGRRRGDPLLLPGEVSKGYAAALAAACIAGSGAAIYGIAASPQPPCSSEHIVIEGCRIPEAFGKIGALGLKGLVAAPTGLATMAHRHAHRPAILGASGFDFVPYLPQTAAQVKSILESLYGLDFTSPPPAYRNRGNLMPGMAKEYWARLTASEWRALSSRFCLGALIAPADWKIHLDPVFEADGIRVYAFLPHAVEQCKISA